MFAIKIAEHVFRIENKYGYINKICQNYLVSKEESENAEIISVTDKEVLAENNDETPFPDYYLETLAIYRKICEALIKDNVFLFHSSAISLDGEAILFTAPSGTGKSTQSRLWREHFADRVTVINDDKPLVSNRDGVIYVHGTPWCGKHGIETNTSAKIKAVVMLEQAKKNEITRLTENEAYTVLFTQIYRPKSIENVTETLKFIDLFSSSVPFYKLKCNVSYEAVKVAHNEIFGV